MTEQFLSCDAPLVVEYLNAINRSSCPWCKSNDWSMITESSAMCVGEPALKWPTPSGIQLLLLLKE